MLQETTYDYHEEWVEMEQVVNGDTDGQSTVSRHQMGLFLIGDVQDGCAELVPFRDGGIPHPLGVLRTPSPPSFEGPTSKVVFDDGTELEAFDQALAQSIHPWKCSMPIASRSTYVSNSP